MVVNKLFLELPTGDSLAECEKSIGIRGLVQKIVRAVRMIDHEYYTGYFDESAWRALYKKVCAVDVNLGEMLMLTMTSFKSHESPDNEVSGRHYRFKNKRIDGMLMSAYVDNRHNAAYAMVYPTCRALVKVLEGYDVVAEIKILEFEEMSLYQWFVDNRNPQREMDHEYKKHSRFKEHQGKRGVVSAWTYSTGDAIKMLRRAVYSGTTSKRLILWHRQDKKMIVFFNENLQSGLVFHAYQIGEDDTRELSKFTDAALKKAKKLPYLG
ncbi:MAG: hypothetical protein K2M49_07290 [Muribaculaceae bacterium]|nr:hypothetical protein [Muribaculaceae bacterium]